MEENVYIYYLMLTKQSNPGTHGTLEKLSVSHMKSTIIFFFTIVHIIKIQ